MGTTLLWVEGIALSAFIAAGSWGAVRSGLQGLAATRYFQLRADRYPEAAAWDRPRFLTRTPALLASIVCWPAAVAFVSAWVFRVVPTGPWIALLPAWPVAAVVLLVIDSRSPWAALRGRVAIAARVPFDSRDGVLLGAYDLDPQLNGKLKPA